MVTVLYRLSQLIPVPMRSNYAVVSGQVRIPQLSTWWQWRGRVYRHRITPRITAA